MHKYPSSQFEDEIRVSINIIFEFSHTEEIKEIKDVRLMSEFIASLKAITELTEYTQRDLILKNIPPTSFEHSIECQIDLDNLPECKEDPLFYLHECRLQLSLVFPEPVAVHNYLSAIESVCEIYRYRLYRIGYLHPLSIQTEPFETGYLEGEEDYAYMHLL